MSRRDVLLAIRQIAANGGPDLPIGWTSVAASGRWYTVRTPGGDALDVNRVNTNVAVTRGLFAICGSRTVLDSLAASSDLISPLTTAWSAALSGPGLARDVMRRWRWYNIDGFVRDPEGDPLAVSGQDARLIGEGDTLPDPAVTSLPWNLDANGGITTQAAAVVRVTTINRPAFGRTILGFEDDVDAYETE